MKRWTAALISIFLLFSAAMAEDIQLLTPDEAVARMEALSYLNIFDVRTQKEYENSHIPGALHFPLGTLKTQVQIILDGGFSYMDAEIFVYGDSVDTAAQGVRILQERGFTHVFSLGAAKDWPYEMISYQEEERRARMILSDFETKDIYGNTVTEDVFKGHRLTMVNIWATYCSPCLNEMPDLARLFVDMKEKGGQIIGIVSDASGVSFIPNEKKVKLAQEIAQLTGADYPHLLPCEDMYAKLLSGVTSVPTTIFVDEEGVLIGYAYLGSRNYNQWKQIMEDTFALLPEEKQ